MGMEMNSGRNYFNSGRNFMNFGRNYMKFWPEFHADAWSWSSNGHALRSQKDMKQKKAGAHHVVYPLLSDIRFRILLLTYARP